MVFVCHMTAARKRGLAVVLLVVFSTTFWSCKVPGPGKLPIPRGHASVGRSANVHRSALSWIPKKLAFEASLFQSRSMLPTLFPEDRIFIVKTPFAPPISRGALIVYRSSEEPVVRHIRRVVALEGDTVAIANGQLWLNGSPCETTDRGTFEFSEPGMAENQPWNWRRFEEKNGEATYSILREECASNRDCTHGRCNLAQGLCHMEDFGPCTVPAGQAFVLGDNRDDSRDSRQGTGVPFDRIIGNAVMIWWSGHHNQVRFERVGKWL